MMSPAVLRGLALVAALVLAMIAGRPAAAQSGESAVFTPTSAAPVRERSTTAACRPATPTVAPIPGRSVVVDRGPAECNTVALTFDAGADRGYAPMILDVLRDNAVPASFGMTGQWAADNPDLLLRMADEGHQMINHTWSHRSFTGFSAGRVLGVAERMSELVRTDDFVRETTGRGIGPYFRPPYGDLNDGVLRDVGEAGYHYTIMWTVDSLGWNHLSRGGIIDRCLSRAEPGAIYIFHVGAQSEDGPALQAIIDGLRQRGLGFVTVSDLLGL